MISCENDYDADEFSYAEVLRKAKNVVDQVSTSRTSLSEPLAAGSV